MFIGQASERLEEGGGVFDYSSPFLFRMGGATRGVDWDPWDRDAGGRTKGGDWNVSDGVAQGQLFWDEIGHVVVLLYAWPI